MSANRLSEFFEAEEVKRVVHEEIRSLTGDISRWLQAALILRLGPEMASRVQVDLKVEPVRVTVTPANAPHSFPEQKER